MMGYLTCPLCERDSLSDVRELQQKVAVALSRSLVCPVCGVPQEGLQLFNHHLEEHFPMSQTFMVNEKTPSPPHIINKMLSETNETKNTKPSSAVSHEELSSDNSRLHVEASPEHMPSLERLEIRDESLSVTSIEAEVGSKQSDVENNISVVSSTTAVPKENCPTQPKSNHQHCDLCGLLFSSRHFLQLHKDIIHSHPDCFEVTCKICKGKFKDLESYRNHVKETHSDRRFICEQCPKSFKMKGSLLVHYKMFHDPSSPSKCQVCKKNFVSRARKEIHEKRFHGIAKGHSLESTSLGQEPIEESLRDAKSCLQSLMIISKVPSSSNSTSTTTVSGPSSQQDASPSLHLYNMHNSPIPSSSNSGCHEWANFQEIPSDKKTLDLKSLSSAYNSEDNKLSHQKSDTLQDSSFHLNYESSAQCVCAASEEKYLQTSSAITMHQKEITNNGHIENQQVNETFTVQEKAVQVSSYVQHQTSEHRHEIPKKSSLPAHQPFQGNYSEHCSLNQPTVITHRSHSTQQSVQIQQQTPQLSKKYNISSQVNHNGQHEVTKRQYLDERQVHLQDALKPCQKAQKKCLGNNQNNRSESHINSHTVNVPIHQNSVTIVSSQPCQASPQSLRRLTLAKQNVTSKEDNLTRQSPTNEDLLNDVHQYSNNDAMAQLTKNNKSTITNHDSAACNVKKQGISPLKDTYLTSKYEYNQQTPAVSSHSNVILPFSALKQDWTALIMQTPKLPNTAIVNTRQSKLSNTAFIDMHSPNLPDTATVDMHKPKLPNTAIVDMHPPQLPNAAIVNINKEKNQIVLPSVVHPIRFIVTPSPAACTTKNKESSPPLNSSKGNIATNGNESKSDKSHTPSPSPNSICHPNKMQENKQKSSYTSSAPTKKEGSTTRGAESKQWECDVCKKLFTTKYFLKKHKRLHTGETPYACAECGKTFTFQQSYHKHVLYHSDDKPHLCSYCGRSFKEMSTLHNHVRIHTGEKPFVCSSCGKAFRQRVSFLVHQRIHTGVMPYKCDACGRCFRYKVSLRSHKCDAAAASSPTSASYSSQGSPSSPQKVGRSLSHQSDLMATSVSSVANEKEMAGLYASNSSYSSTLSIFPSTSKTLTDIPLSNILEGSEASSPLLPSILAAGLYTMDCESPLLRRPCPQMTNILPESTYRHDSSPVFREIDNSSPSDLTNILSSELQRNDDSNGIPDDDLLQLTRDENRLETIDLSAISCLSLGTRQTGRQNSRHCSISTKERLPEDPSSFSDTKSLSDYVPCSKPDEGTQSDDHGDILISALSPMSIDADLDSETFLKSLFS